MTLCYPNRLSTYRGVNARLAQCLNSVLNVKAVVAAFNHEKALVEAFSVIIHTSSPINRVQHQCLCVAACDPPRLVIAAVHIQRDCSPQRPMFALFAQNLVRNSCKCFHFQRMLPSMCRIYNPRVIGATPSVSRSLVRSLVCRIFSHVLKYFSPLPTF